jgi:hypothetical protein
MGVLAVRAQHTGEGRLAGEVDALVGQRRHDARRGHVSKARLVGRAQHGGTLGRTQGMGRRRPHDQRPAIARHEAVAGLPALQGAQVDTDDLASQVQSCATVVRDVNSQGK